MKRSKFTESQISFALQQAETGVKVEEVCRKMGISDATCDQESKMHQKWESECSIIRNSNTSKMGTIMQR